MSRWRQFPDRRDGSGSAPDQPPDPRESRPEGELLWSHATSEARLAALIDLGCRLRSMRPETHHLITLDRALSGHARRGCPGVDWLVPLEGDGTPAARHFLRLWKPDLCVWTGGRLKLHLVSTALDARIPLILVDAEESELENRRRGWFSDPIRKILFQFRAVMVPDNKTAATLQRFGVPDDRLVVTTPFRGGRSPTPFDGEEVARISASLTGRPIWLASQIDAGEIDSIVTAHRNALRLAHRLLLVITPADPALVPDLQSALEAADLRHTHWVHDTPIEDYTQVVISGDPDDLGLWCRVAPITFLGGSLLPESGGRSPFEAAALGSAILHGPNVGQHDLAYSRLGQAGASREIRDAESLSKAIVKLSAPDAAAAMALAGWEVMTEGADATDRLLNLVQDILDSEEAAHARA